jgi:hypothetical protein
VAYEWRTSAHECLRVAYEWRMSAYEGLRGPTSAHEWRMSAYEYERAPNTRLPERFFVSARDDL